jgi:hypothetical protein
VIEVRRLVGAESLEFEAIVRDANGETRHRVTMAHQTYERLTGGRSSPEHCVEAAFEFLLAREPKESILPRFDLSVISRYFPEFERQFPPYLQRTS